jgi:hypothetical protein
VTEETKFFLAISKSANRVDIVLKTRTSAPISSSECHSSLTPSRPSLICSAICPKAVKDCAKDRESQIERAKLTSAVSPPTKANILTMRFWDSTTVERKISWSTPNDTSTARSPDAGSETMTRLSRTLPEPGEPRL